MSEANGDIQAGRLVLDVVADTSRLAAQARARVQAATRDLKVSVQVEPDTRGASATVRAALRQLEAGLKIRAGIEPDATGLKARLRTQVQAAASGMNARVGVQVDTRGVRGQLRERARELEPRIRVGIDVHTVGLKSRLAAAVRAAEVRARVPLDLTLSQGAALRALKAALGDARIELDLRTGTAAARITAVRAQASREAVMGVKADTGSAKMQVERLRARASDPVTLVVRQRDSGGTGAGKKSPATGGSPLALPRIETGWIGQLATLPLLGAGVLVLAQAITQLSAGMFSMVAAVSPAVGLLGALPGLFAAGAQAAGALFAAFSGVGEALKAMGAAEDEAARSSVSAVAQRQAAADRVADAIRGLQNAQRAADAQARDGAAAVAAARQRVALAQESAARSIESADRDLAGAERGVADAHRDAARAQQALNEARQDAQRHLEDLNRALARAPMEEEKALLAVEEAKRRLHETNSSPYSDDLARRQADVAYREALANLEELRERNKRLSEDTKKANEDGVEGSDQVKRAKEALADAERRQLEAIRGLRDAEVAAARARVEAVRSVQRAQAEYARTVRDSQEAGARAAEGVSDAQRELASALRDQHAAATGASAAQQRMAAALADLAPAGQRFATFLHGTLIPALQTTRAVAQTALLPPLQEAITRGMELLPLLNETLADTGAVLGQVALAGAQMITSGPWRADLRAIAETNTAALGLFGAAGLAGANALRHLMVAAGPLVLRLAQASARSSELVAHFLAARRASGELSGWFATAGDVAGQLARILGNITLAVLRIGAASVPAGQSLLAMLESASARFAAFTAATDTQDKLAAYFSAAVPVVTELGRLLADVVMTWARLSTNPAMAVLLAQIRTQLLPAVAELMTVLSDGGLWTSVVGALTELARLAAHLGGLGGGLAGFADVLGLTAGALNALLSIPGMDTLLSAVAYLAGAAAGVFLLGRAVTAVVGAVRAMQAALMLLNANPVGVIITLVGLLILYLINAYNTSEEFRNKVNAVFSAIGEGIAVAARWIADTWLAGWSAVVGAARWVKDAVGKPIQDTASAAVGAFRWAGQMIARAWAGLREIWASPVRFLVNTVYNAGIRPVWNWVAAKIGMGQLPAVTARFAAGGVVPGYAPGQDTVPALLSPGEGVLVPQAVRALGGRTVIEALNTAGRTGALGALLAGGSAALGPGAQRFAGGGMVAGAFDQLRGWLADVLAGALGPVRGWLGWLPDSAWGQVISGLVTSALDQVLRSVRGYATGGIVTGPRRGTDSVLSWLTPGEGVLTESGVARLGGPQMLGILNSPDGDLEPVASRQIPMTRIGTQILPGAIVQHIHNPVPETAAESVNARLRALAAFGIFDGEV